MDLVRPIKTKNERTAPIRLLVLFTDRMGFELSYEIPLDYNKRIPFCQLPGKSEFTIFLLLLFYRFDMIDTDQKRRRSFGYIRSLLAGVGGDFYNR
jgi:hypothetical protein